MAFVPLLGQLAVKPPAASGARRLVVVPSHATASAMRTPFDVATGPLPSMHTGRTETKYVTGPVHAPCSVSPATRVVVTLPVSVQSATSLPPGVVPTATCQTATPATAFQLALTKPAPGVTGLYWYRRSLPASSEPSRTAAA